MPANSRPNVVQPTTLMTTKKAIAGEHAERRGTPAPASPRSAAAADTTARRDRGRDPSPIPGRARRRSAVAAVVPAARAGAAPEGEANSRCHSARRRGVADMEHPGETAVGLSPTRDGCHAGRRDRTTRNPAASGGDRRAGRRTSACARCTVGVRRWAASTRRVVRGTVVAGSASRRAAWWSLSRGLRRSPLPARWSRRRRRWRDRRGRRRRSRRRRQRGGDGEAERAFLDVAVERSDVVVDDDHDHPPAAGRAGTGTPCCRR